MSSGARWRISCGIVCAISSSMLRTPTVLSMASMSRGEGPIWRRSNSPAPCSRSLVGAFIGCVPFDGRGEELTGSGDMLLVGGFIHQAVELRGAADADLEQPRALLGLVVDHRR